MGFLRRTDRDQYQKKSLIFIPGFRYPTNNEG
jgi:hypothetical protein